MHSIEVNKGIKIMSPQAFWNRLLERPINILIITDQLVHHGLITVLTMSVLSTIFGDVSTIVQFVDKHFGLQVSAHTYCGIMVYCGWNQNYFLNSGIFFFIQKIESWSKEKYNFLNKKFNKLYCLLETCCHNCCSCGITQSLRMTKPKRKIK